MTWCKSQDKVMCVHVCNYPWADHVHASAYSKTLNKWYIAIAFTNNYLITQKVFNACVFKRVHTGTWTFQASGGRWWPAGLWWARWWWCRSSPCGSVRPARPPWEKQGRGLSAPSLLRWGNFPWPIDFILQYIHSLNGRKRALTRSCLEAGMPCHY